MDVRSYAALAPNAPLEPFTVSRREVGPDDVGIDIKYAGICHSDIHQAREEWFTSIFPMVPGHEIAGIVTAVGSNVTAVRGRRPRRRGLLRRLLRRVRGLPGGRAVLLHRACRPDLQRLRDGRRDPRRTAATRRTWSSTEDYVLRLPDSLGLDVAAPLLCAGITCYQPLPSGRPARACASASSASAASATWASRSPPRWAPT